MEYRTENELILPEYGRNIQSMVDIALTIEDRAERNRCARSIIDCMGNLFPYLRDSDIFKHKLWDHLALMSRFQLDIDYPYEIADLESMTLKPEKLPLDKSGIKARHYGRFIEKFVERIANNDKFSITNRPDHVLLIANHMKRSYYAWNQELIDDATIFEDIYTLSKGTIDMRDMKLHLTDITPTRRNNNNNNRNKKH
ncbi:MAG: DUF4290 domain-containing protein [bacterium]